MDTAEYARKRLAADIAANPIAYYRPNRTAALFHAADHQIRILFGGNQSGKTYACIAEAVMAMTGTNSIHCAGADKFLQMREPPPPFFGRHWCANIKSCAETVLLPKYMELLPYGIRDTSKSGDGSGYNREKQTLYLLNGSWMQFKSYKQVAMDHLSAESTSLHGVILDEPPPEIVFNSQRERLWRYGGKMWGAMTVWEQLVNWPIQYLDRRVRRHGDGDHVESWTMPVWDNAAHIDIEQVRRDVQNMSEEEYAARVEGQFGRLAGLVYPEFDPKVHASYDRLKPDDFVTLAKKGYGHIWCALDHGMRDPTACIWVYVARTGLPGVDIAEGDYLQFREYKVAKKKVPAHLKTIQAFGAGMPIQGVFADPSMWTNDPAGGLSVAQWYIKAGLRLIKGNHDKDAGHQAVSVLLRQPIGDEYPSWPQYRIVKGTGRETVEEFLGYVHKALDLVGRGGDKTIDVNDHLMDDLRYLAMGRPHLKRRMRKRIEPQPVHPITGIPLSQQVWIPDMGM